MYAGVQSCHLTYITFVCYLDHTKYAAETVCHLPHTTVLCYLDHMLQKYSVISHIIQLYVNTMASSTCYCSMLSLICYSYMLFLLYVNTIIYVCGCTQCHLPHTTVVCYHYHTMYAAVTLCHLPHFTFNVMFCVTMMLFLSYYACCCNIISPQTR